MVSALDVSEFLAYYTKLVLEMELSEFFISWQRSSSGTFASLFVDLSLVDKSGRPVPCIQSKPALVESYKVKKQGELGLLRNQQCQLGLRDQKRFPDHQQVVDPKQDNIVKEKVSQRNKLRWVPVFTLANRIRSLTHNSFCWFIFQKAIK